MARTRLINKRGRKAQGKCYFCGEDKAELLDVHRIVPGSEGGRYTDFNSLVLCPTCHRKVHAGLITVHRKYRSTGGKYVLHYTDENGQEKFD